MAALESTSSSLESCPSSADRNEITPMDLRCLIEATGNKLGINLKEKQLEAIQMFFSGKDVFVSLPTGYGKSVIYGILPLVYNSLKSK